MHPVVTVHAVMAHHHALVPHMPAHAVMVVMVHAAVMADGGDARVRGDDAGGRHRRSGGGPAVAATV